jgi:hypothetical protein
MLSLVDEIFHKSTTPITHHVPKQIHEGSTNINIPPLDVVVECTKGNVIGTHRELEMIHTELCKQT